MYIILMFIIGYVFYLHSLKNEANTTSRGKNFFVYDIKKRTSYEEDVNIKTKKTSRTYINENGYRCFTNSNKSVSRWVAEKHLLKNKRKLTPIEVVHHIDGNKLNNKPSNLQIFKNQYAHDLCHRNQLKYNGTWHAEMCEHNR